MKTEELEATFQPMMNGTTQAVKQSLLELLIEGVHKTHDSWRVFTAELWARGVTKEQFVEWAKEQKLCQ